ncbi:hypothetical protein P280DRAFT_226750 [Massarina eburnea CBS 473.64]|uniref:DUF8035 domain-containing protein n=1 Tax=Massarina eburnea CBS 473.64 TaxID=1395130 RepID=A0A6A6SCR0_9PLEO|nr:hypothetical protein P280DRAFT_226750 [Massarina eburnea CBS 473.64]
MAVLAAILPFVSRCSALALNLYRLAAVETDAAKDLLKAAKAINNVSLIVKQVGTIIKEDDRLPSSEAFETLEDVLAQCGAVLGEIESTFPHPSEREYGYTERPRRLQPLQLSFMVGRLPYLLAHTDSLRSTLAVMLQTLHTAQSVMWARVRPTVSPSQCATAVANEKQQLETLIIEQQMSILWASKQYKLRPSNTRLLMEHDSSRSLVALDMKAPQPSKLFKYQDDSISSLDVHNSDEAKWLPTVCSVAKSQLARLLDRWSRLRQIEESLRDKEHKAQAQKREAQQPFVESDSEEDGSSPRVSGHRPSSTQPLFTETSYHPIPIKRNHGPDATLSPASSFGVSPKFAGNSPPMPTGSTAPVTPRTSIATLPVEAADAIKAKDKDDDIDLGIPWTLCTRRHYWKYIDSKLLTSNTDAKPSEVISDRSSWTEIMASWVCKEAIQEAGYKFAQVQKEKLEDRRTRFEPCLRIEQALNYEQVHRLVERTVEIFRKTQAPTPPREQPRQSSFDRRTASNSASPTLHDRDRMPIANMHPSLGRSYTAYPPPPPLLDRSSSMPVPTNPHTANVHPPPTAPYPIQTNIHNTQQPLYTSPQAHYAPQSTNFAPRHPQPNSYSPHGQPHRYSFSDRHRPQSLAKDYYYSSASESSDSGTGARSRRRRSGSESRSRSRRGDGARKKKDGNGAAKAMIGIAGLTALLDGLVGI